ncbi:hypothetical protein PR048_020297 [Dryococelus australis]|uniref:Uncharacterized protein n=1 Tax=Dryococelus australis TaxID=614101 RepID=A0ABQ9H5X4_9NEOP|nr:hypothetical protein PR048_020297 [Dryococelus australis]
MMQFHYTKEFVNTVYPPGLSHKFLKFGAPLTLPPKRCNRTLPVSGWQNYVDGGTRFNNAHNPQSIRACFAMTVRSGTHGTGKRPAHVHGRRAGSGPCACVLPMPFHVSSKVDGLDPARGACCVFPALMRPRDRAKGGRDETGSEDDHENSIGDNEHKDNDNVEDDDGDSFDFPTHFPNEFPSTSDAKKAEDTENTGYTLTEDPNELVDRLAYLSNLHKSQNVVSMEQRRNARAGGNERIPRKPADQLHRPARFPHAKIWERPRRETNPVRLTGRRDPPFPVRSQTMGTVVAIAWPSDYATLLTPGGIRRGFLAECPIRVIEVSMKLRRNERAGQTGEPRENPSTTAIVRHDAQGRPGRELNPVQFRNNLVVTREHTRCRTVQRIGLIGFGTHIVVRKQGNRFRIAVHTPPREPKSLANKRISMGKTANTKRVREDLGCSEIFLPGGCRKIEQRQGKRLLLNVMPAGAAKWPSPGALKRSLRSRPAIQLRMGFACRAPIQSLRQPINPRISPSLPVMDHEGGEIAQCPSPYNPLTDEPSSETDKITPYFLNSTKRRLVVIVPR